MKICTRFIVLFVLGHSNLANHARTRHTEKVQAKNDEALVGSARGSLENWITVIKYTLAEARNIFHWIEWIVTAYDIQNRDHAYGKLMKLVRNKFNRSRYLWYYI